MMSLFIRFVNTLIASRVLIKHLLNPTFYLVFEECMYVTNPHFEILISIWHRVMNDINNSNLKKQNLI